MKLLVLGGGAVVTEFYLPAFCLLGRVSDVLIIEPSPDRIRDISHRFPSVQCKQAGFQEYLKDGGKLGDLMAQSNHPNRKGHELVVKELSRWFPE